MLLERIGRLGGAAAAGGGRDALSYGVSFATTRSHQLARGAPACFLSGISGWFSLSLGAWVPKNLARRTTIRFLTTLPCSILFFENPESKQRLPYINLIRPDDHTSELQSLRH